MARNQSQKSALRLEREKRHAENLERKAARRAEKEKAADAPPVQPQTEPTPDSPCPKCGAQFDYPCLTKAGKEAKKRHKERG